MIQGAMTGRGGGVLRFLETNQSLATADRAVQRFKQAEIQTPVLPPSLLPLVNHSY